MKDDKIIVKYIVRFQKVLKEINYKKTFIKKIKIRKFISNLLEKLAELI